MNHAEGLLTSVGFGEIPFLKQATISVWQSAEYMKKFAYKQSEHASVIKKTRQQNWYSEELFARLKPIKNFDFYEE